MSESNKWLDGSNTEELCFKMKEFLLDSVEDKVNMDDLKLFSDNQELFIHIISILWLTDEDRTLLKKDTKFTSLKLFR